MFIKLGPPEMVRNSHQEPCQHEQGRKNWSHGCPTGVIVQIVMRLKRISSG